MIKIENMKRILEVGPGLNPLHYRHGDKERGVKLEGDEDYTVLDQPRADFNHRIWQTAKETYGERIHFVPGDRTEMPFEDESFDELVSLGSFADEGRVIAEFQRVLRPGGILRLGTTAKNAQIVMDNWGVRLKRLGFTLLEDQIQRYQYVQRKDLSGCEYVVFVFKKGV